MSNQFYKNLNLAHLKYFWDATTLESISKSAEINFVTQSSVSQAITKLESVLKKKLIKHQRKTFQLTSDGQYFLDSLSPVMLAFQQLEENFQSTPHDLKGTLEIASSSGLASAFLQDKLIQFNEQHPKVTIKVKVMKPDQILQAISLNQVEVGFIIENLDLSDFKTQTLHRGQFKTYRHISNITPLNQDQFILSGNLPETRRFKQFYQTTYHKPLKVMAEIESWLGIAHYLQSGKGIGLLPDYIPQSQPFKSILVHCFSDWDSSDYRIVSVHHKTTPLSNISQTFLNACISS